MSGLRSLVATARDLRARGAPFAIATVVGVRGSSYRRPGARMILTSEQWLAGSVSGGCVEDDLLRKLRWRMRSGGPVVVTYDASDEDARVGFGLGCNGAIDVLQEQAASTSTDPLVFAERCVSTQRRGALATVIRTTHADVAIGHRVALFADGCTSATLASAHVAPVESACRSVLDSGLWVTRTFGSDSDGTYDVFVERFTPPPRLFVFGAGHDAVPLVKLARSVGWDAVVCAPHARPVVRERFASADDVLLTSLDAAARHLESSDRALAVVMNHDYEADKRALDMLLRTNAAYIGVLGPRARSSTILAEIGLGDGGDRFHAPVGLAIGADTPEEIALAIVAEAQATLARAPGKSLRERTGRVHQEVA